MAGEEGLDSLACTPSVEGIPGLVGLIVYGNPNQTTNCNSYGEGVDWRLLEINRPLQF